MIPLHEELLREFQNFAKTAPTAQSVMERIAQRLHEEVARYNWVGFYLVDPADPGNLLAVAGAGGLQVFHFNGASPITAYTGPLTTVPVDQLSWDNANHLYAISQSKGQLFVFTVTPSTNSAVSGSPYSVANPANLVVVSQ